MEASTMRFGLVKVFPIIVAYMFCIPANASQMLCHLSSLIDGSLLETLKIGLTQDNVVTIWHRHEPTGYSIETEEKRKGPV